MKKLTISILLILTLFIGLGVSQALGKEENPLYNKDGSITVYHSELMEIEWCNHNKGKDFAKDICEEIWGESE